MHIRIATEAGACYGVNRALDMVEALSHKIHGRIHTLGPLIHNPQVVSKLAAKGVEVIHSADEVSGKAILLRTHGVTPEEEKKAYQSHDVVVDATCPFVIRAHRAAEKLTQEGYQVLVFGEKGHAEVEGTLGHAPGAVCVETPEDIEALSIKRRVGIVVQTTQSRRRLKEIVAALVGKAEEIRLFDTICEATSLRQDAATDLAKSVDCMIVIGGKISANTTRLAEICRTYCDHVYHIETAEELDPAWFSPTSEVGITAGASTPQYQIDEVYNRLMSLYPASDK
jgi:hypothetical protein